MHKLPVICTPTLMCPWVCLGRECGRPTLFLSVALSAATSSLGEEGGNVLNALQVTCLFSQEKAISIWESENFFFDLEPLPGAVEAVKQMANLKK